MLNGNKTLHYQFNPAFRIKETPYGGLVFDPMGCKTLSVSADGYAFLSRSRIQPVRASYRAAQNDIETIASFLRFGILIPSPRQSVLPMPEPSGKRALAPPNTIESIHFLITERCSKRCTTCYVQHPSYRKLSLRRMRRIIDEFCRLNVFQVAIGGGEPFSRRDLPDIVEYLAGKGVVVTISTNGSSLRSGTIRRIRRHIKSIQLSIFSDVEADHDALRYPGSFRSTLEKIRMLQGEGVAVGINVLVHPRSCSYLQDTLEFISRLNIARINVIKLKYPVSALVKRSNAIINGFQRWNAGDYESLGSVIEDFQNRHPEVAVTVDCSLAGSMKRHGVPFLLAKGISGCSGGKSFIVVKPNGDAYPCCYLNHSRYRIGSFLRDNIRSLVNEINASPGTFPLEFNDCPIS